MNCVKAINAAIATTVGEFQSFSNGLSNSFGEAHLGVWFFTEDNIAIMKNGDIGVMYEVNGIYDEPLTTEGLGAAITPYYDAISKVICGFPAYEDKQNVTVQHICIQKALALKDIDKVINAPKKGAMKELCIGEVEHLLKDRNPIVRKHYFAIRYHLNTETEKMISWLSSLVTKKKKKEWSITEDYEQFSSELNTMEHLLSGLGFRRLGESEYIKIVQSILNKGDERTANKNSTIAESILSPSYDEKELSDGYLSNRSGDVKNSTAIFHMFGLPEAGGEQTFGQYGIKMGEMRCFMDHLPANNVAHVWTFTLGSKKVSPNLKLSLALSRDTEKTGIEMFNAAVEGGAIYGMMSYRLIIHDATKETAGLVLNSSLSTIRAIFVQEKDILVHAMAVSLPLNATPEEINLKGRRSERILLNKSMAFIPLYSGPRPSSDGLVLLARNNEITRVNLFKGESNRLTAVLGQARMGKSTFTNCLVADFKATYGDESVVMIIDVRTSYEKLADQQPPGSAVVVSLNPEQMREMTYNFLSIGDDYDDEDLERLIGILKNIIVLENPEAKINSVHTRILTDAVKIAYNENRQHRIEYPLDAPAHPTWTKIYTALPRAEAELERAGTVTNGAKDDITNWLICLKEGGKYGYIVNRIEKKEDRIDSANFLVFDISEFTDKVAEKIATLWAYSKIMRKISPKRTPYDVKKLFIAEEFGLLVKEADKSNTAAEINIERIGDIQKSCPKCNLVAFAITNNVSDFAVNPAGIMFWEQTTQKVILPLGGLITEAKKHWGNSPIFNDARWQVIESLRLDIPNKRSSAFIISENPSSPFVGSVHLCLSPRMFATTSSDGSVRERYKRDKKEFGVSKAISILENDFPYGKGLIQ